MKTFALTLTLALVAVAEDPVTIDPADMKNIPLLKQKYEGREVQVKASLRAGPVIGPDKLFVATFAIGGDKADLRVTFKGRPDLAGHRVLILKGKAVIGRGFPVQLVDAEVVGFEKAPVREPEPAKVIDGGAAVGPVVIFDPVDSYISNRVTDNAKTNLQAVVEKYNGKTVRLTAKLGSVNQDMRAGKYVYVFTADWQILNGDLTRKGTAFVWVLFRDNLPQLRERSEIGKEFTVQGRMNVDFSTRPRNRLTFRLEGGELVK